MSKTDDLDSTSRGIWVFPYDPSLIEGEGEAGPSRRKQRPLKEVYSSSLQAYRAAYEVYEDERAEDQLDDLTHWLNHHAEPDDSTLFHRLPIAILQNPGKKVHGQLSTILGTQRSEVVGVQGRDILDIGSGIRAMVSGLLGDGVKSGMTGLDLVEDWWKGHKYSPTVIVHIQDAQIIPPQVLGEIIYIITLHPQIPFRLLLSVPSTSTFLAGWQLLEPSSVDLTILQGGRGTKNALGAMLDIAKSEAKITVGDDFAEVLKRDEGMFGHGPEGALKAIQWGMLHHSVNSPLATLASNPELGDEYLATVEAIVCDPTGSMGDIGKDLFSVSAVPDLAHVTDPSPRISILQALANTSSFLSHLPKPQPDSVMPVHTNGNGSSPSTPKKRESRHTETTNEETDEVLTKSEEHQKGDLGDLDVLYNLWKGAGKQVNLWDWLQGYKNHITGASDEDGDGVEDRGDDGDGRVRPDPMENENPNEGAGRKRKHADEAVDEDRLHATFVRFCEEARMLGMVRARGKAVGRKADEVVKGVTLL